MSQDVFKKIFDWQWLVSMPQMWVYTKHQYEDIGIATSGNKDLDNFIMGEYVKTMRSIAQLAELHEEAKNFIIVNTEDTKKIFDIIVEYLNFASENIHNSVTYSLLSSAEPDEKFLRVVNDLVKLQNLGNKIFPVMVENIELQPATEGLLGWIDKHQGRYGVRRFDHNPIKLYNIDIDQYRKDYNKEEKSYNIINLQNSWNNNLGSQFGGYL